MNFVNTPYDDVFRTLLNDCSSLIIPLINEVFGERYTGKEQIVFSPMRAGLRNMMKTRIN